MRFSSCCKGDNDQYVYQRKHKGKEGAIEIQENPASQKLPVDLSDSLGIIKIKKSQYQELIKKYKKSGKKFTDIQFPPQSSSIGNIQGMDQNCKWKRISELIEQPQLFSENVSPENIVTERLEKCYFTSAIAALAEVDQRIYRIFEGQQYNTMGIYRVKLRIHGTIEEIIIDDYLPVDQQGKIMFCQPKTNDFWMLLLEKAWAKIKGSYSNIQMGNPLEVFKAITYAPTKIIQISAQEKNRANLWCQLVIQTKKKRPICVGTALEPPEDSRQNNKGLIWSHFYSLINVRQFNTKYNQRYRILKLRNPWGRIQWQGHCSQKDSEFWDKIDVQEKEQFWCGLKSKDDGIFFIQWKQFCQFFQSVEVCYYEKNPCYEIERIYPDRKHGNMYVLTIKTKDNYIIELHQTSRKHNNRNASDKEGIVHNEANRGTIFIMEAKDFEFMDGAITYDELDSTFQVNLEPGKYLIYAKIDPLILQKSAKRQDWLYPQTTSISLYSQSQIASLKAVDKNKITPGQRFYHKMFVQHARNNKNKVYDNQRLWISYRQFLNRSGFAYICFCVEYTSSYKFIVSLNQKDFHDINYSLKKPYKGQGKINFEVKPGEQIFVIARVMKGIDNSKMITFPPPINVKIKSIK